MKEPPITNLNVRRCVIADIDGTLADCAHRRHFVDGSLPKNNWVEFVRRAVDDTPIIPVINAFHVLQSGFGWAGVLCSGRSEKDRDVTERWLKLYCVQYEKLYMRPNNDSRKDSLVKEEMLAQIRADGYMPYLVLDDRNSVVAMWRANGLTCFQVADGDF